MAELIISVSGLRGIIGENLNPDVAARFACAYAAGQADGPARAGSRRTQHRADAGRCDSRQPVGGRPQRVRCRCGRHAHGRRAGATTPGGRRDPGLGQPQSARIQRHQAVHRRPDRCSRPTQGEQVIERFQHGAAEWVQYPQIGVGPGRLDDTLAEHTRPGAGHRGCRRDSSPRRFASCWTPIMAPAVCWAGTCWRNWAAR